jgi:hypothetical protein
MDALTTIYDFFATTPIHFRYEKTVQVSPCNG